MMGPEVYSWSNHTKDRVNFEGLSTQNTDSSIRSHAESPFTAHWITSIL